MILTIFVQTFYFALAFAPPMLVGSLLGGVSPWMNMLLLLAACTAGFVCSASLGSKKLLAGIPALAAFVYLCVRINGLKPSILLPCLTVILALILSLHHRYGKDAPVINPKVMVLSIVLYVFGYGLSFFTQELNALCTPLGWLSLALMAMTLVLVNRQNILEASGGQAKRMLGGNQALTFGFLALLVLVVCLRDLRRAVTEALRALLALLLRQPEAGGTEVIPDSVQMGQMDLLGLGEAPETPQWLQILGDVLMYVISIVSALALVALIVFALSKWFRKALVLLRKWLQSFQVDNAADGYTEESEQLLSVKSMAEEFRRDMNRRIRKLFTRPVSWDRLNPEQKIRRLYQNLLRELAPRVRGALAMAPEDLLRAADKEQTGFASLYNEVRYADAQLSNEQAEQARKSLRGR